MQQVAPLRYGVIFKKAFCDPQIFTAFAQDVLGIPLQINHVETEKRFSPPIGYVDLIIDLFAQDDQNRVIVEIQHVRYGDHYDAVLHYHCAALLEQIATSENYRPTRAVYTIVVLTSGDKHQVDWACIDFDPKTRQNEGLGEIPHRIIYLCPKYANEETPPALREWLQAIDDTLDKQVDESRYTNPQIQRVFAAIQDDLVSPQERFLMIEEYNREQLKQQEKQAARAEGIEEGKPAGIEEEKQATARAMLKKGLSVALIAEITGLSSKMIEELLDS